MSIWQTPVPSPRELQPVWRALSRDGVSVDHYGDRDGWHLNVDRLQNATKTRLAVHHADDATGVVIAALPDLPGIGCRLALLAALVSDTHVGERARRRV